MNLNKIRRHAYKQIWKEGKTHQEVYDEVREKSNESPEEIAITLKSIPSKRVNDEKKWFWIIHIVVLIAIIGLRGYALSVTPTEEISNLGYLIPLLIFSMILPVYGVYGATRGMMFAYGWVGLSMIVNLILIFAQTQYVPDQLIYVTAGLYVVAMLTAGIIPRLLRTKYTKTVEEFEKEGKKKKRLIFTFPEDEN